MFRLLHPTGFKVVRIHGPMNRLGRAIGRIARDSDDCVFAILVSATAIYLLENEAQPEAFSSIQKHLVAVATDNRRLWRHYRLG